MRDTGYYWVRVRSGSQWSPPVIGEWIDMRELGPRHRPGAWQFPGVDPDQDGACAADADVEVLSDRLPPPGNRKPKVMMRALAVCGSCWNARNPHQAAAQHITPMHDQECVDCEQARGAIFVRMRVEWL